MDGRTLFDGVFTELPVLITGHTGFKGSWLSIWLNELGAKVIGYSCEPAASPGIFNLCGLEERITHIVGDVRDLEKLSWSVETYQPRLVIHMAAQALVKVSYQEPKNTFDTNIGGTVNVLEALRQTKSVDAFLGITSDKVYQEQSKESGYRESDPLGGKDPYSASKAAAELVCQSYRQSWGEPNFARRPLAIATARGANVIGGGDFARFRLVPDCMRSLMARTPIKVRSPKAIRPWQHVLDLLSGYLWLATLLMRQPGEFAEAWNFGPPEDQAVTCETVVKRTIDLWGSGRYELAPDDDQVHETEVLKLNCARAASRLAWLPTYNWEEALAATVRWFRTYQNQPQRGVEVAMYNYCVRQIEEYVNSALERSIKWTQH